MALRRWSWIGTIYYYLAALTGLVFVLTGATLGLLGAAKAAFPSVYWDGPCAPDEYCNTKREVRNDGFEGAIAGAVTVGVGAPVLLWHLAQVRRREAADAEPAA